MAFARIRTRTWCQGRDADYQVLNEDAGDCNTGPARHRRAYSRYNKFCRPPGIWANFFGIQNKVRPEDAIFAESRLGARNICSDLLQARAMASALTSWKEIAQHLGKGVRTVQRWEREGLPVRRPKASQKGRVLAFPDEIDRWVRSTYTSKGEASSSELAGLRTAAEKLLAENESLRRNLSALMGMESEPGASGRAESPLLQRCSQALGASRVVRRRLAEPMRRNAAAHPTSPKAVDAGKDRDVSMDEGN